MAYSVSGPTSGVVLRAVVLHGASQAKLRQLDRFVDLHRVGQPCEVHHVHSVANCQPNTIPSQANVIISTKQLPCINSCHGNGDIVLQLLQPKSHSTAKLLNKTSSTIFFVESKNDLAMDRVRLCITQWFLAHCKFLRRYCHVVD